MDDDDFMASLPEAVHVAVVLAWFKGLPTNDVLGDCGVIHELTHLLHIPDEPVIDIRAIREQFKEQLKLA
jgi:hypothetical protein